MIRIINTGSKKNDIKAFEFIPTFAFCWCDTGWFINCGWLVFMFEFSYYTKTQKK